MKEYTEIIKVFIEKLGKYFWLAILCTLITIFGMYYTKYPEIFNLSETTSGSVKFISLIILLIALFQVVFTLLNYFFSFARNHYFFFINSNKEDEEIVINKNMVLKNPDLYPLENSILYVLSNSEIQKFNIKTLQRLLINEFTKSKNNNSNTFQIDRIIEDLSGFHGQGKIEQSIDNLMSLKLIKIIDFDFYSVTNSLWNNMMEQKEITNVANN